MIIIVVIGWSSALALAGLPLGEIPPFVLAMAAVVAVVVERLGSVIRPVRRGRPGAVDPRLG